MSRIAEDLALEVLQQDVVSSPVKRLIRKQGNFAAATGRIDLGGHPKTGQRTVFGTRLFYPPCSPFGKPVLVRQLRGPHFSRCPW